MRTISTYIEYIKNNAYKKFLGVIYYCEITSTISLDTCNSNIRIEMLNQKDDLQDVVKFYHSNGRNNISEEYLKESLKHDGYICIGIQNDEIVAATCLFSGTVKLHGSSKYTLYETDKSILSFDDRVLYSCYIFTKATARSSGIYQQMLTYMKYYLSKNEAANAILLITNTNNEAMMHLCNKHFNLIGLVQVKIVMGKLLNRKVIYLDYKYKCWKSE